MITTPEKKQFSRATSKIADVFGLLLNLGLIFVLSACGAAPNPRPTTEVEETAVASQAASPSPERAVTTEPAAPSATPTESPVPLPTLDISSEDLQGISVRFWHPWTDATGEELRAAIAAFNAGNEWGIMVSEEYHGSYNDLYARVEAALSEGSPPDLVVGYNYQLLAWEADLADLEPLLNDPQWGFPAGEQADFFPFFWEQDLAGEKRIGFPAQRSALLLYYNLSWARELGFESPPDSPEAFKEQACAAALANRLDGDPENDGTGGWVVNTSPAAILSWLYAFGGEVFDPEQDRYRFDTPQAEAALLFLKDLYDNGCAWKLDRSDTADGFARGEFAEAEFAGRQALFAAGSLADLPRQAAAFELAGNPDEWTVLGFPSPDGRPVIDAYGPSFAIMAGTAAEQLAAWTFIHWLSAPEQQAGFITAGSTFPTRASAVEELAEYSAGHPQWSAALDLLPYAKSEPRAASWSAVRWVVGDVGTQVFRSYFTADRIPATLALMEETATELQGQFR